MELDKIIQFSIKIKDFTKFDTNPNYTFIYVGLDNAVQYKSDILNIIEYHHNDLNWDGIPSYDTIIERLEFGSKLHLWVKNDKVIGWHWYNPNCVTLDWKTNFQNLNPNELYIGSSFLSSAHKGNPSPSYEFYRRGLENTMLIEGKDTLYLYVDNWNTASIKLCKKCGMKEFNFIK